MDTLREFVSMVFIVVGITLFATTPNPIQKTKSILRDIKDNIWKFLKNIFKKPSTMRILIEKDYYNEQDERPGLLGIQKYDNIFHCKIYNSEKKNILEDVSVVLMHHESKKEFPLRFHQFKSSPKISIQAGHSEIVYLVSYNSDISKKLCIKGTTKHTDVDIDPMFFGLNNTFTIKVFARNRRPQFRKFAIVVTEEEGIDSLRRIFKAFIQYIEPQLSR